MDPHFFRQDIHVILLMLVIIILPSLLLLLQRRKLPPGPFGLPLIGNLHQLSGLPHRSFQQLSVKYGPMMFLHLGSVPTLVISSMDMAREVFQSHDIVFSGRPALYSAKKFTYGCLGIAFSPYGEHWREMRKIAVFQLLSAKKVQSFETARKEEVAHMMDSIASSSDGLVDLSETLLHLVNDTVCRVVFGKKFENANNDHNSFHELLQEIQDLLGGFCVADFFPWLGWIHKLDGLEAKLEKHFQKLDEFYDEIIQEHMDPGRPKPEVEDLVDVMLRLQREPETTILSSNHVKGVLTDMFLGATDSSSTTIVWAMAELINNPTEMKKTQENLREGLGKKKVVEECDLPRLEYLKLVVKETLRLHPPAPLLMPRETTESCTIQGYNIPAKTRVFINAKSIATDPRSWKSPEQFLPERFLDNPVDFKGLDYEFIPFGVGRRGCPGMNFAIVLVELVLANILHCFNWEMPQGLERGDVDMEEAFGITMNKKEPLRLIARMRQTA